MRLRAPSWLWHRAPPRLRDRVRRNRLWRGGEEGIPPAVDGEVLREIARSLLGSEPTRFRHANVSGYKRNNAYLISVADGAGHLKRLVYKRIDLRKEVYPAIDGFPGPVGWPEIHAYDHPSEDLRRFLPRLLRHVESHERMRHEFFLEDLNSTHRRSYSRRDAIRCTSALLDLESALRDWMPEEPRGSMIRYDGPFPAAFLDYAHDSLEDYVRAVDDEAYVDLLRQWPGISKWYLSETPDEAHDRVHGDYRLGNIFQERANSGRIRVVDLEFAGYGWIHHDLASLFKKRYMEAADEAISMVATRRPEWSETQHWRMYQRCRLERGLLDSSLLAGQRVALSENPYVAPEYAARVVAAVSALDTGSRS